MSIRKTGEIKIKKYIYTEEVREMVKKKGIGPRNFRRNFDFAAIFQGSTKNNQTYLAKSTINSKLSHIRAWIHFRKWNKIKYPLNINSVRLYYHHLANSLADKQTCRNYATSFRQYIIDRAQLILQQHDYYFFHQLLLEEERCYWMANREDMTNKGVVSCSQINKLQTYDRKISLIFFQSGARALSFEHIQASGRSKISP